MDYQQPAQIALYAIEGRSTRDFVRDEIISSAIERLAPDVSQARQFRIKRMIYTLLGHCGMQHGTRGGRYVWKFTAEADVDAVKAELGTFAMPGVKEAPALEAPADPPKKRGRPAKFGMAMPNSVRQRLFQERRKQAALQQAETKKTLETAVDVIEKALELYIRHPGDSKEIIRLLTSQVEHLKHTAGKL